MIHRSLIYQDQFGTEKMRAVWTEESMVQSWLDYEAAVSSVQGELGIIPKGVARTIVQNCTVDRIKPSAIAAWNRKTKHVIVALVKAFRDAVPGAGEQFHLGLTTQDILDTGLTLQIRDALTVLVPALFSLEVAVIKQAVTHRNTIMMGRSEGQHGSPITFGYKLAVIASEIHDHIERLADSSERLMILTMFGVMGVQSSYCFIAGKPGARRFTQRVGQRLNLRVPIICPHHRTDRFAELGWILASLLSTLGETGLEIRDLQRTEVGEVTEPWNVKEQFSSSTLPHKQNPEPSEWLEGLATLGRGYAGALLDTQQQHERDISRLPPELHAIPNLFLNAAAAVASDIYIFSGLQVHEEQMKRNVMLRGGLAMAESVMLGLATKSNRKVWAHQLVHDIAMSVARSSGDFAKTLGDHPEVSKYLSRQDIDNLLKPERYVGTAADQVDAVGKFLQARRPVLQRRFSRLLRVAA